MTKLGLILLGSLFTLIAHADDREDIKKLYSQRVRAAEAARRNVEEQQLEESLMISERIMRSHVLDAIDEDAKARDTELVPGINIFAEGEVVYKLANGDACNGLFRVLERRSTDFCYMDKLTCISQSGWSRKVEVDGAKDCALILPLQQSHF